jgi:hypothetical protein
MMMAMTLNEAFERRMIGGEKVLALMRGVVDRERAWAGA